MNHVFALVWNASMACWTVTHEHSKRCRKGARRLGKLTLPALLLSIGVSPSLHADALYWDGGQTIANSTVDGGDGMWTAGGTNWTSYDGQVNQAWADNDYASFTGATGTVTVDGTQAFGYMQFGTDGYKLVNGTNAKLTAVGSNLTEVRVFENVTATIDVNIDGASPLKKNDLGTLVLNGANTYSGGTELHEGTIIVGSNTALGSGPLTTKNGTTLDSNKAVTLDNATTLYGNLTVLGSNALTLNGVITGTSTLTKDGLADLTLSGVNTFSGTYDVRSGSLITNSGALNANATVNLSSGANLNLGASSSLGSLTGYGTANLGSHSLTLGGNANSTFAGDISGSGGLIKLGNGTLSLTGNNSITGNTTINAGTLDLSGSLASSQVNVNTGGTFTGSGSALGTVNINNGGHLALSSDNTLSAGALVLGTGSNVDVALGAPSTTSLMNIGGNVTLDGNLNVSDAGGFGVGVYRLFNYTGALTDLGLDVASAPAGYALGDLLVQTGQANQINIQVSAPNSSIRYWDGSQTTANGAVDGGTGTWTAGTTNWTDANGLLNQTWAGDFAVFQGAAGTVTVDGTQLFTGMQFLTDDYNLVNGAAAQLTAVNGTGGTTAVRVDSGVTGTIGANIDGSGILNKLDSGTLVLNGANTYSGGTQLNGGKIVVGSNTALGSGTLIANAGTQLDSNAAVALSNATTLNGNLTVLGSNALTLDGVISGTGGLIKNGASTLSLTGNNTYSGGTLLSSGALIVGSNTALGTGALNAAGGTTLDANTATSLSNTINLGSGNLSIGGAADLTLGGVISGAGALSKNGASNLILNGTNTYTGGTTLNAGTLTLDNAAALGAGALSVTGTSTLDNSAALLLANNVNVNSDLTLAGNNDLTLAGVLSGNGTLIKNGLSELTLTGNNSFSGDLNIASGGLTLQGINALGTANLNLGSAATVNVTGNSTFDALTGAGNLTIGAPYTLSAGASNASSVYDGILTGTGSLTKLGTGKLVLNGNSVLNGGTTVNGGSLIIGGASGSTASLTSDAGVANGALLGGHGTITGNVNVASGGTLAPGNSIGTLSVVGNVTLTAGSLFEVEANPDGTSDSLTATGDVSLNSATLSLIAANGTWAPNTSYTIISAANVIGTFATPTVSNLAFLDASVDYSSGNSVVLNLARNDVTFTSVAVTDNQRASSAALASLGAGSALYTAVSGLSSAGAQAAYDNLSGELHASLQSALLDDSRYLREGLNQRLLAAQGLTHSNGVLNAAAEGPIFWLQGYGGWARNDGDGNAAQLDHDSQGTLFGGDIALNDTWRVGAAVGLGTSDIDVDDRDSSADIDSQSLALYASGQWDQLNLRLGAGRTWNEIDSRRQVSVGAINEREKASYDATTTQVFSELGYRVSVDTLQLEPFIGLAHVQFEGDSFAEKGGSAALSSKGEKQDITYSTLGLRGSVPIAEVAGWPVSAQGGLSWQHAFGGETPDSRLAFTGGDSFQVQGTPMERNSVVAELGVQTQLTANTSLGLIYSGRFGEDYRDNSMRLGLSIGF